MKTSQVFLNPKLTNGIDTGKSGWYLEDNHNSRLALRISHSNLELPGEIRFNNNTKLFEGYNGNEWILLNGEKGETGDNGKDFNENVIFNNMTSDNSKFNKVVYPEIIDNQVLTIKDNNIVNVRTLASDSTIINDSKIKHIEFEQSKSSIKLNLNQIPYTWDLKSINLNDIKKLNSDGSFKAYGNISKWSVLPGNKVDKGTFVSIVKSKNKLYVNKVDLPNDLDLFNNPISILGVALNDSSLEVNVCTYGITQVLVTNNISSRILNNSDIKNIGTLGLINNDGKVYSSKIRPMHDYIIGGYFIDTGIIKNDDTYIFMVNPTFHN
tara:strand:+ start:494 stop:1465 length:972 start_codon:yes stop_codon:yes gene_type:complete